ncbi:hypothetical protein HUU40_00305 [candidate division KSB1 bacterium]|nr:hypothetical protein [candidate division KSB1 bacterium]
MKPATIRIAIASFAKVAIAVRNVAFVVKQIVTVKPALTEGNKMADPVGFEGANVLMSGEAANCRDLEVFADGKQFVSCWRLTAEEMSEIAKTGVVWVSVWGGGMPPILISGTALVFIGERPAKAEPIIPKRKDAL